MCVLTTQHTRAPCVVYIRLHMRVHVARFGVVYVHDTNDLNINKYIQLHRCVPVCTCEHTLSSDQPNEFQQ